MTGTLTTLAYIDPAATTALISSLTAVGVAIGATFIILWRKFKKGVNKVLRKDENAGKIVEDELVITDEETSSAVENTETATENQQVAESAATEAAPTEEVAE